jgi:hypothetical protein
MSDSHGNPVVDSAMSSTQRTAYIQPINGSGMAGPLHSAVATGYYPLYVTPTHLTLPSIPTASADALTVQARTNPSRPEITPLNLIQDLVDIPKQLKDVGKLIKSPKRLLSQREIANQYLGVKFGWLPLIKDVQDLLDLGMHIHRRANELHNFYANNGMERRLSLQSDNAAAQTGTTPIETNVVLKMSARSSTTTSRRRWATCRWKPTVLPPFYPSDAEIIRQAKRISLGLTADALYAGAWDVLPWTWLINWFTNFGDFAKSHSNTVPATCSIVNVMTQTETHRVYSVDSITSGFTGGDAQFDLIDKVRFVGLGSVSANIPFIGVSRLSILSALFVQRFKG